MNCTHLIEQIPGGVRCRKNGGPETTCSHGVCRYCDDGGGKDAAWKRPAPMTTPAPGPAPLPSGPRVKGVGDYLHTLIFYALHVLPKEVCGCDSMRRKMNAWGSAGCEEHRAEIIAWLCEQAKGLPRRQRFRAAMALNVLTVKAGADKMLNMAIRRCEQESDHFAGAHKVIGEEAR